MEVASTFVSLAATANGRLLCLGGYRLSRHRDLKNLL